MLLHLSIYVYRWMYMCGVLTDTMLEARHCWTSATDFLWVLKAVMIMYIKLPQVNWSHPLPSNPCKEYESWQNQKINLSLLFASQSRILPPYIKSVVLHKHGCLPVILPQSTPGILVLSECAFRAFTPLSDLHPRLTMLTDTLNINAFLLITLVITSLLLRSYLTIMA